MEGKPMIVIPIAYDQPAVAARVAWLNVAEVLSVTNISAEQLRLTLEKILKNPSYRDAAIAIQANIREARGLECAADLIEDALEKYAGNHRATSRDVHCGIVMDNFRDRDRCR
jgi:UDP:flavonoid glycosyltransferase YjiC (YdhE family)